MINNPVSNRESCNTSCFYIESIGSPLSNKMRPKIAYSMVIWRNPQSYDMNNIIRLLKC